MGGLLSTSSSPPPAEQKRIIAKSPSIARSDPLFLDEVKAERATWSEEGICRTIQRFFGLLPDSPGEVLKKEQQYPLFRRRSAAFMFNVGDRAGAVIAIQQLYRRYHRLRIWHEVSNHMVQLARGRLDAIREREQENISAASFRLLLVEGFSASKVCVSGALKTIQLRLVLNAGAGECYLTWIPSRKKKPRINLHDIEQVIPVCKEGNPEAPRLSKKVSHRRGIIIVCKSYHRGRVVLEVATKRERNILLEGFQKLVNEMTSTEPTLDNIGALRSQHPRRQSMLEFFGTPDEAQISAVIAIDDSNPQPSTMIVSSLSPRRGLVVVHQPENLHVDVSSRAENSDEVPEFDISDSVRADAKAIEHFYQTRFDDSSDNTISIPSQASRRPDRTIGARH